MVNDTAACSPLTAYVDVVLGVRRWYILFDDSHNHKRDGSQ